MTALIIVSHSRKLAEGVRELADAMAQGRAVVLTAAGVSADETALGTDAVLISEALSSIADGEDILVFMDQGSALISAEMALELVEPELAARVRLTAAPLVEGVTAAAAAAAAGLPLDAVLAEASTSLLAKREQLGEPVGDAAAEVSAPADAIGAGEGVMSSEWTVRNPHGLHARPTARIVAALSGLAGEFRLWSAERSANALSIGQLARLGVRHDDRVRFEATGPDAATAIGRFEALCSENFGDVIGEQPPAEPDHAASGAPENTDVPVPGLLAGIAAAPGIAVATASHLGAGTLAFDPVPSADPATEAASLAAALARAEADLDRLADETRRRLGAAQGDIFDAHRQILADPALKTALGARLAAGVSAAKAFADEMADLEAAYASMADDYARARAADARDLCRRVLALLGGKAGAMPVFNEPTILVADDLSPSDTAGLDPAVIVGLCLAGGGRTSHSAILARALGIPAVVGLGASVESIAEGQTVILDGDAARVLTAFDDDTSRRYRAEAEQRRAERLRMAAEALAPTATRDGFVPEILANIATPAEADGLVATGAGGVGLMRSEFLFMDRPDLPSEQEQADAFSRIAERLDGRPLIIRTLDVGGDKPVPALQQSAEDNPFLGCRGARLALARPEVFSTHLRAILRTAAKHPGSVRVMFPMVSTLDEWHQLSACLDREIATLTAGGLTVKRPETGVMIEVPAAVFSAEALAAEVDFFSIGTNDLTQYVMAADRGNATVAALVDPLQPAVLAAIAATCQAARAAGIPVGMCGEMAGDPRLVPLLLGLGISELSMSPPAIAAVKAAVRDTSLEDARRITEAALAARSAREVISVLGG